MDIEQEIRELLTMTEKELLAYKRILHLRSNRVAAISSLYEL